MVKKVLRANVVPIRVSAAEKRRLREAAARDGLAVSTWARRILLDNARATA